MMGLTDS